MNFNSTKDHSIRRKTTDKFDMSSSEITLLKQVTDPAFKQKIFLQLVNTHGIILLKDKFDRNLPLKVFSTEETTKLFCKGAVQMDLDFSYSETYTAHFMIDSEKYMFEAFPSFEDGHIAVSIKRIYHLQRRQTMRYKVPGDVSIKLTIGSRNEEPCLLDCTVSDLNTLGCSVFLSESALAVNDLIDATLIVNGETSLQLQGVIKNVRNHDNGQQIAGVEFHHLLYSGEEKLSSMISELHNKTHLKSS